MGFGVLDFGFRGFGFRVSGLGSGVWRLGLRGDWCFSVTYGVGAHGSPARLECFGFQFSDLQFRVYGLQIVVEGVGLGIYHQNLLHFTEWCQL